MQRKRNEFSLVLLAQSCIIGQLKLHKRPAIPRFQVKQAGPDDCVECHF